MARLCAAAQLGGAPAAGGGGRRACQEDVQDDLCVSGEKMSFFSIVVCKDMAAGGDLALKPCGRSDRR